MLNVTTIKRQGLGGVAAYYADGADDYYAKDGSAMQWEGQGAQALGLSGAVDQQQFKDLLDGKLPDGSKTARKSDEKAKAAALQRTTEVIDFMKGVSAEYGGDGNALPSIEVSQLRAERDKAMADAIEAKHDPRKNTQTLDYIKGVHAEATANVERHTRKKDWSGKTVDEIHAAHDKAVAKEMARIAARYNKERLGYDLTFSAPKSVSLQALVGGDAAVVAAHDKAVKAALAEVETMAGARTYKNKKSGHEQTGNIVAATFRHETSREVDPQLHTHAIVMNLTQREDGQWRALSNEELMQSIKHVGEVYKNTLNYELRNLGYELRFEPQNKTYELAHISREQTLAFSARLEQIDFQLAKMGLTRETASAEQKTAAALKTRAAKGELDRDAIYNGWVIGAAEVGIDFNTRAYNGYGIDGAQKTGPVLEAGTVLGEFPGLNLQADGSYDATAAAAAAEKQAELQSAAAEKAAEKAAAEAAKEAALAEAAGPSMGDDGPVFYDYGPGFDNEMLAFDQIPDSAYEEGSFGGYDDGPSLDFYEPAPQFEIPSAYEQPLERASHDAPTTDEQPATDAPAEQQSQDANTQPVEPASHDPEFDHKHAQETPETEAKGLDKEGPGEAAKPAISAISVVSDGKGGVKFIDQDGQELKPEAVKAIFGDRVVTHADEHGEVTHKFAAKGDVGLGIAEAIAEASKTEVNKEAAQDIRTSVIGPPPEVSGRNRENEARLAVAYAVQKLTERQSILTRKELMDVAFAHGTGKFSVDEMKAAIVVARATGKLIEEQALYRSMNPDEKTGYLPPMTRQEWINKLIEGGLTKEQATGKVDQGIDTGRLKREEIRYTTQIALNREKEILSIESRGRGVMEPMVDAKTVAEFVSAYRLGDKSIAAAEKFFFDNPKIAAQHSELRAAVQADSLTKAQAQELSRITGVQAGDKLTKGQATALEALTGTRTQSMTAAQAKARAELALIKDANLTPAQSAAFEKLTGFQAETLSNPQVTRLAELADVKAGEKFTKDQAYAFERLTGARAESMTVEQVAAIREIGTTKAGMMTPEQSAAFKTLTGKETDFLTRTQIGQLQKLGGIQAGVLSGEQARAIEMVATSENRVTAVVGRAGTGKSYMTEKLTTLIEQQGFKVISLAPYGMQVESLKNDVGLENSKTVAAFLASQKRHDKDREGKALEPGRDGENPTQHRPGATKYEPMTEKHIIIVDEAGVVGTRIGRDLMREVEKAGARILFLGDTEQTKAIEAGKPLEQLLKNGMQHSVMDDIQRQKNDDLLQAVKYAVDGKGAASLEEVKKHNVTAIREIAEGPDRYAAVVQAYAGLPEADRRETLVITGTNESRKIINDGIQTALGLKESGIEFGLLGRFDSTQADRRYAKYYEVGTTIIPESDHRRQGLERGHQYTVIDTGTTDKNMLTVRNERGEVHQFNPSQARNVSVYKVETNTLAVGDLVKVTHNDRDPKLDLTNGDRFKVVAVTKDKILIESTIRDREHKNFGKTVELDTKKPLHLALDYASTVHSAQGLTADRVIINLETNSRTTAKDVYYVALSRAKYEAVVFTDSISKLPTAIQRETRKLAALDLSTVRDKDKSHFKLANMLDQQKRHQAEIAQVIANRDLAKAMDKAGAAKGEPVHRLDGNQMQAARAYFAQAPQSLRDAHPELMKALDANALTKAQMQQLESLTGIKFEQAKGQKEFNPFGGAAGYNGREQIKDIQKAAENQSGTKPKTKTHEKDGHSFGS
ncbi:MobF family relaxase [Paraburkholderia sp. GAS32]|uniref:MobF family relaxase n=1 Tax=Paraburkholderia sp. GAS32 TaxID=3035129 RepID=UPI003D24B863